MDSTDLNVCHNRRLHPPKVFAGLAARGKTLIAWFFGFKVHFVFNDRGELRPFALTLGNVHDRKPVSQVAQRLFGKLFGDKGYLSQWLAHERLELFGVQWITQLKKNMKNRLIWLSDRLLLRKRGMAETLIDQLKNISPIEHSRHRSPVNVLINRVCGLIAYCHQSKKPSLHLAELPALIA